MEKTQYRKVVRGPVYRYFQAIGQALKAAVLSMLRQLLILVPLSIILPILFGLKGILFAGPIADISSAVIVALFVIPEMKKLNSLFLISKFFSCFF